MYIVIPPVRGFAAVFTAAALAAGVFTAFASCASSGGEIPDGLSAAELVQRAQEASDKNRYVRAAEFYQAILTRYPDDIESTCAAQYEIAFIHHKLKQTELAREEFERLLARYDGPDGDLLPQKYRVLAEVVLSRMAN